jgi:hypothetical protein
MIFDFEHSKIESDFNIGLSIKGNRHELISAYTNRLFTSFCEDLNLSPSYMLELRFEQLFTDVEFNTLIPEGNDESFINSIFYPKIFSDLKKHEKGKLEFHTKFGFTLDQSLTPEKTTSGVLFGTLSLGNKPVLYYIYVDIKDIISTLKSANTLKYTVSL